MNVDVYTILSKINVDTLNNITGLKNGDGAKIKLPPCKVLSLKNGSYLRIKKSSTHIVEILILKKESQEE